MVRIDQSHVQCGCNFVKKHVLHTESEQKNVCQNNIAENMIVQRILSAL